MCRQVTASARIEMVDNPHIRQHEVLSNWSFDRIDLGVFSLSVT